MSLQRVLKLLEMLGFSRKEAKVYVYLTKTGTIDGQDLAEGMKIKYEKLGIIIESLKKKGAVTSDDNHLRHLVLYTALPFEELLNRYIEMNLTQAQNIKVNKLELLANWKSLSLNNNSNVDDQKTEFGH